MKKLIYLLSVVVFISFNSLFSLAEDNPICGIGVQINKGYKYSYINVNQVFDNSPAKLAGLKPNDKILKINNKDTLCMSVAEAQKEIVGQKGTKLELIVQSDVKEKKLVLVRDNIKIPVSAYAPKWEEFCPFDYLAVEYHDVSLVKGNRKRDLVMTNNYWVQRKAIFDQEIATCNADKTNQSLCYTQVRQLENNRNAELRNAELAQQQNRIQAMGNLQNSFDNMQMNNSLNGINNSLYGINTNLNMMNMKMNHYSTPYGYRGY